MRRVLFVLVLCGLVCVNPGPPIEADDPDTGHHELSGPVKVLWEARSSGSGHAGSLAVSPDGSTVFVPGEYGTTLAYDGTAGEEIWSTNGPYIGLGSLAVTPDGSTIFVAGYHLAVAYDASTGEEIWLRYSSINMSSVAANRDGTVVFCTGSFVSPPCSYEYGTVAHDAATGEEIWSARYNGPASVHWPCDPPPPGHEATSLAVSPDGSVVFVTGGSYGGGTDHDYATIAYDAATGEEIWITRYDWTTGADFAASLAVSPDGSVVFVTGGSFGGGTDYDYATIAYDAATGEEIWITRYGTTGADFAASLAVSPDGSVVFVTGSARPPYYYQHRADYATIAYDAATGEEIWNARYDGSGWHRGGIDEQACSVAVSPDGSTAFVTGTSFRFSGDVATVAYATMLQVEIDIRSNRINPYQYGVVPVVIYGSDELDVADIDVTTLRFGPGGASTKHDLTDPFDYNEHTEDANLDGYMDLITHFRVEESGIVCGDTEATLSGQTLGGQFIEGTDTFETVGCNSNRPHRGATTREFERMQREQPPTNTEEQQHPGDLVEEQRVD
jgi:WD40 repeat protein